MALHDFFEPCVLLEKRTTPDGYGGVVTAYIDGATVRMGITTNSSTEALIADKSGVKAVYTIAFDTHITLSVNDRVKRVKDGKVFRITSDATDMQTPAVSSVQFRQCSAEVVSV